MECLFCKIRDRQLPSFIVYEDELSLAFLDIRPTQKGHTLVIPKQHVQNFLEADPQIFFALLSSVQRVARGAVGALNAAGCNISTNNGAAAGQVIFHLHWHIIPRFKNDGLRLWVGKVYEEGEAVSLASTIASTIATAKA